MPGGLLALVCYGNENVILNGNPEVTWFYKSFMRHTHFAQEPVQVPLDGPGLLQMDAPIILKAKIPRQGDLLSDLVLRVTLPDVFSKIYFEDTLDASGNPVLSRAYEFQWVRLVGVRLIDTITLTIGGTQVQQFNSDWIAARAVLDLSNSQYAKWRYMVGDVPELFDPASGIYADTTAMMAGQSATPLYPNVMGWRGTTNPSNPTPIQNNAPSIPGRILRIPLGLWFSDYIANSLPLVGLQYHDVEIQIVMRPIRDLYTVLDPSGNRVRPGFKVSPYIPSDQYYQIWNPTLYGPLPNTLNNLYISDTDPQENMRYFLTDISGAVPSNDGWPLNATLEATYTFVREQEQLVFSQKTLRYNVRQMTNFAFYGIKSRATYRLDVHNVSTRIVSFLRRSDAISGRNAWTNLTNWMYPLLTQRPFVTPAVTTPAASGGMPFIVGNGSGGTLAIGRSGLNIPGTQRQIMLSMFITANGQPLFNQQDAAYFSEYVSYRYLQGYGAPYGDYGLATQSEMWPLNTYSFALDGSSIEQPKGTLNTSRIDRLELDIDVAPIPVGANYTYELQTFVEQINFLEITSGMGGLKFAK
jgi:hypothetical protein